jgi:hemolysin activation/secretion protein
MKTSMMNKSNATLSFISLALLASAAATSATSATSAPVVPDAGQVTRELQQQLELIAPKAVTPLRVEGEAAPKSAASSDVRIAVTSIRITGYQVFTAAELHALVADLAGAERSLAELNAGAARITAYYRERGFVVARAYLPAQDIKDGAIVISVLEGVLDQQRVTNKSRLPDARANGYLGGIMQGDVMQAQQVDRALLLLADTPGVGGARASLQPGSSVGTTDLLVELDPAQAYAASVDADNYGNRYIGEYRVGAALALNSPLMLGDLLSFRLLTSGDLMSYARLAYQVPVGVSGLKLGGAYADTRYKLGKEFASLQARGTASSASVYASYPFLRSQMANLSGTLTWENKKLVDQTNSPASNIDKQVRLATVGLAGSRQDALLGGGLAAFEASLARGDLTMDAASLALDAAPVSAQSNGSFTRLAYTLSRLQRVSDSDTLFMSLTGQRASKNLNSSEKFSLGGASGVRAYPQGEGSGDQGWLASVEVRHSLTSQLQGVLFYDAGSVDISHDPYAAGDNTRSIAGAGLGLNGQYGRLQFKTSVAWRTSGGQPTSEPASVKRNPRWWAQASLPF